MVSQQGRKAEAVVTVGVLVAADRLVLVQPGESQILAAALLGRHPAVVLQHGVADGDPSGDGLVGFEAVPGGEAEAGIVAGVQAGHVEVRDAAVPEFAAEARHVLPPIEIGIHQDALRMGAAELVEIGQVIGVGGGAGEGGPHQQDYSGAPAAPP